MRGTAFVDLMNVSFKKSFNIQNINFSPVEFSIFHVMGKTIINGVSGDIHLENGLLYHSICILSCQIYLKCTLTDYRLNTVPDTSSVRSLQNPIY